MPPGNATNGARDRTGEPDRPDEGTESTKTIFEELRAEFSGTDPEEVLQDPAYLDSVDEIELSDSEAALDEVLADEVDDVFDEDRDADRSDGNRSNERDDGEDDRSTLVDELIAELEGGAVSERQRAALLDGLGVGKTEPIEIQLDHLKARFVDLEAYLEVMEDTFGRDPGVLESIEALEDELATLRSEVEAATGRLETVERAVAALAKSNRNRHTEVAALDRSVTETNAALERNFTIIERELERNRAWRSRVHAATESDDWEQEDVDLDVP